MTTTTTTTVSPMTLLTLPSELIETVLISSRSPRTVAAVAQTCRKLRTLVYASPDSHLWRALFLTTWDDPRPALAHRALVDPRIDLAPWDWGTEYRRRVSADKWLKAWRRDICPFDDDDADTTTTSSTIDPAWRTTAHAALAAVLDTLLTLQPFPATLPIALRVLTPTAISPYPTGNEGSGMGDRRARTTSAPPLPPLLIVLATGISAFDTSRSGMRVGRMVYGPHATRAADSDLEAARAPWPTPSLPPQLVRTLLASCVVKVRGVPGYAPSLSGTAGWARDGLGDVFHRIVCITGFVPIPPPMGVVSMRVSGSVSDHAGSDSAAMADAEEDGGKEAEAHRISTTFPSCHQQYTDARVLARRRVYDMQYLCGNRLWGPYQIVTRLSHDTRPGASPLDATKKEGTPASTGDRDCRLGTLAWAMGMDIEPDSDSTSDDSKDEDWHDPSDRGQGSSAPFGRRGRGRKQSNRSQDTTDADIDIEPEHPLISLIVDAADNEPVTHPTSSSSRRRTRRANPRLPPNCSVKPCEIKPHHLRPDYAYLASVRIVVEANLRELFGNEIGDDLEEIASETMSGGVGLFWEDEDEIVRARSLGAPATFFFFFFAVHTGSILSSVFLPRVLVVDDDTEGDPCDHAFQHV